jgi:tetratricopeptide (TPR) repeat protein
VTISPEHDRPWIKLVEYQLASGDKEKAIDLLSTAINACPDSANLASLLGDYYIEEGSYAESIPYLKKAFSLEPGNSRFALKLGTTLQNIGQTEEAVSIYQDALSLRPDDPGLLDAYTNALISCSRNAESVEPLFRLIAQHPSDIKPYLELAAYALSNRTTNNPLLDLESIEPTLQEGLQIDPENITGRLLFAELLAATNREELAKEIYVSLSEDVNLPIETRWKVNYGLGLTSTKLGQIDIALAALEEAGSQNPSNFVIHQKLAETYAFANLPNAAIESAQAALAIAPSDAGNLIWYSEFCTKAGDFPEALSSLDAAIKQ